MSFWSTGFWADGFWSDGFWGSDGPTPPTPTPGRDGLGGDDVPRRKSPERGFDLTQWKARQIDLEGSIRETYTALVHGPLVKDAKELVSPYVQTEEVDWKALARDDEAIEQMLLLQEEEEAVMLLLLQ